MAAPFNPVAFALPARHPAFSAPAPAPAPTIPSGTFVGGTKVQVGGHRVVIERYLSEGGFAHVYLVRLPKAVNGNDEAVLKRVAVPDKESLASMRTEVETMKKLKGRHHIVTYIDSHASQLKGGGYEVFLLMEYCNGGGLIDFMNTRLQNRLTEPEILKIFSDVAQGVACMHYLKPPLLHRDLKVENVLISTSGSSRRYKLCDFGSTASPRPAATSAAEGRLIEDDVQKHTTLQYRSPEMIDVYRKQPIDEKSDIWALGVLLYKLCYYKTPFEEQGQMAILNASFKFPGFPSFSDQLKKLIAWMLRENPQQRPNIYETLRDVSRLRGTEVPIKDIYAGRTPSEARRNQHLPPREPDVASPPMAGAYRAPPKEEKHTIPEITPMRRGRPTRVDGDPEVLKPNPSPLRGAGDGPWAALDSAQGTVPSTIDDPSLRFPPLDDFSLLSQSGSKYAFEPKPEARQKPSQDISQRVTNYLADDAFAQPTAQPKAATQTQLSSRHQNIDNASRPSTNDVSKSKYVPDSTTQQPSAQKSAMVSTGTMTSPPPSPPLKNTASPGRPAIFRFPPSSESPRASSQPRASHTSELAAAPLRTDPAAHARSPLLEHRSRSQILTLGASHPAYVSPETSYRSTYLGDIDGSVQRSKSANSKTRPSSVQTPSKPNILRRLSREWPTPRNEEEIPHQSTMTQAPDVGADDGEDAIRIDSNVDFLKAMEEEEASKRKEKRLSGGSKHIKRASMPSVSLSGTKSLLAGRFGDAFKRFETNTGGPERRDSSQSPVRGLRDLTPIAGSEATDGRSDDGNDMEESQEIPPEMRRELERRRLSQEEKRVADAGAAYRQRLAEGGEGGRGRPEGGQMKNKAASIQSKVRSLLDESGRGSPSPTKTAFGYGRFTDSANQGGHRQISQIAPARTSSLQAPAQSPSNGTNSQSPSRPKPPPNLPPNVPSNNLPPVNARPKSSASSAPPHASNLSRSTAPPSESAVTKPAGPPKPQNKPQNLRTGDMPSQSPAKPAIFVSKKPLPPRVQQEPPSSDTKIYGPNDDWEANFTKRYPDLAGLEMVETEIDSSGAGSLSAPPSRATRIRDV